MFTGLKVWHRLLAAGLMLCVPLAMLVYFLVEEQNKDIAFARKEIQGVEHLSSVLRLVEHLQKHRGLAQRVLGGDRSAEAPVEREKALVEQAFAEIARSREDHREVLYTKERESVLHERWKALREDWRGLEAVGAWTRHSALVEDALALIQHIGNTSNLITDPELDSYYLMDVVVNRLPAMTELLGQIRGLGAGAAAAGRLDAAVRDRLLVSYTLVQAERRRLDYGLEIAFATNPALRILEAPLEDLARRSTAFMAMVEKHLLGTGEDETIGLDSGVYFDTATAVIAGAYARLDVIAAELIDVLEGRIARIERNRYLLLAAAGAVFAAAAVLGMLLVVSVTRPLARAVEVFRRIEDGHYDNEIDIAAGGELLMLLRSLKAMQEKIRADIAERMEAHAALRESEQQFRIVTDGIPALLAYVDADRRYRFVNKTYEDWFGVTRESVQGRHVSDIHGEDGYAELMPSIDRVLSGQRVEFEKFISDTSMGPITVEGSLIPNFGPDGAVAGYFVLTRDVTERVKAEASLRESEARFRAYFDNSPIAMYHKDSEDRYLMVNRVFEEWYGVSEEDVIGKLPADIFDEALASVMTREDRRVLEQGEHVHEEVEFVFPSGKNATLIVYKFPICDADGSVAGVGGGNLDITERKQVEEALQKSEKRFRDFAEAASDWFWEQDADLRFTSVSPEVYEKSGVADADHIGKTRRDIVTLGVSEEQWRQHEADLAARRPFHEFVFQRRDPSGELRDFSISGKPIYDSEGHFMGYRGIGRDITERKLAEEALRNSEARLRQAQEIARIGNFEWDETAGRVIHRSDTIYDIYGISPDEQPRTVDETLELVHPDDRERIRAAYAEKLRTGKGYDLEYRILRADGEVRYVHEISNPEIDESGVHVRSVGTVQDITERRRAEGALRNSEEQLKRAQEIARIGNFEWDETADGIIFRSDMICDIYGFSADEQPCSLDEFMEYVHPDDRERIRTEYNESKVSGKECDFVYRLFRPDGEVRYVHEISNPEIDESGVHVRSVGTVQDITERRLAELRLVQSEFNLRQLIQTSNAPIFAINKNRQITEWNDAAAHITGHAKDEVLYCNLVNEFVAEASRDALDEVIDRALVGEGTVNFEFPMLAKGGGEATILFSATPQRSEDGDIIGVIGVGQDITERKRAEEALRLSEERLSMALSASNAGYWLRDMSLGRIFWSDENYRLLGYEPQEMEASYEKWAARIHPDDRETTTRTFNKCIEDRTDINLEYRVVHTDGTVRWINNVGKVLTGPDGQTTSIVTGIQFDISERKRVEEENALLESQLVQAQKMEAIGTLAGGIAHDFNNILAGMVGYCHLARDAIHEDSEASRDIGKVLKGIDRAASLVSQILTFSRRDGEKRKPIKLYRVVLEVLDFIRASVPATIEIRSSIDRDAGVVLADPTQIHQVMMNLCGNAADAIGEKTGVIEVSLTGAGAGRMDALAALDATSTGYVALSVRDSGSGMDEETMARIFDPFFTTKEVGKGTGLGLAVVHGIVGRHGGAIDVKSEPGHGTTFTVYLPCFDAAEKRATASDEPIPVGSERILLIDDEIAVIQSLQRILSRLGYEVQTMASGAAALEALREAPDRYDIVVTDQTMPELTGEALADQIFSIRPELPVILCSGYIKEPKSKKRGNNGIQEYLLKPINPGDLARAIRRVLDEDRQGGLERNGANTGD